MTELTPAEIDSLTECECGHFANEHSSDGCLATDFSEDWRPIRDDDKCSCTHSPAAINRHAVEAIKAAARAEGARDMRTKIETLADELSRCAPGRTCGDLTCVNCFTADRLRALLADGGEPQ